MEKTETFKKKIYKNVFSEISKKNSFFCLGHSQYATQCTSQSYCVSITSKNGPVQRSCDGNFVYFLRKNSKKLFQVTQFPRSHCAQCMQCMEFLEQSRRTTQAFQFHLEDRLRKVRQILFEYVF